MNQYKIGKYIFTQEELSWEDDKKLVKMFKESLGLVPDFEKTLVGDLIQFLLEKDFLKPFLNIILKPVPVKKYKWFGPLIYPELDINVLKNSILIGIVNDFFLFNEAIIRKLKNLSPVLDFIAQSAMKMMEPEKNMKMKASSKKAAQPK